MIRISVIDGAPAQSFTFDDDIVRIGRSRRSTLVLKDKSLSRIHCEIAAVNGKFLLVNHAKTNGTCVNGQPVGEAFLRPGDNMLVGRVALRFDGGDIEISSAKEASGAGRRRSFLPKGLRRRMDPMVYAVAYAAGLGASALIYWAIR